MNKNNSIFLVWKVISPDAGMAFPVWQVMCVLLVIWTCQQIEDWVISNSTKCPKIRASQMLMRWCAIFTNAHSFWLWSYMWLISSRRNLSASWSDRSNCCILYYTPVGFASGTRSSGHRVQIYIAYKLQMHAICELMSLRSAAKSLL